MITVSRTNSFPTLRAFGVKASSWVVHDGIVFRNALVEVTQPPQKYTS